MRPLIPASLLLSLLASPAVASPGLWGYQGLVTMPDARVAQERELEVGAHAIAMLNRPMATAGFARYGLMSGLEASLVYGVPGHPYLSGGLKYQLMRPSPANPMGVAMGATLLGVPASGPIGGTSYFLALSRDVGRWGSVHAGFEGDLGLNTRLMLGLEVPLLGIGRLLAEGRGPQTGSAPYANVGAELAPLPWLRLAAGTLGEPGSDWWVRSYYAGGSLHAVLPEYSGWFTQRPAPSPAPRATPTPPKAGSSPTPNVQPPALPAATLIGRVVGTDGTPRAGLTVMLLGSAKRATTNNSGFFYFPALAPGNYQVQVVDGAGNPLATSGATLGTEPVTLTVQVKEGRPPAVRRGSLAGTVADALTGAPLPEVRLMVVGPGVSVLATSNAAGQFQVIDLPPGDYQIRAERKGYRPEAGLATIETAALNPVIRLMMTREQP